MGEIGDAIEAHLRMIGLLKDDDLDENQRKFVEEKRAELASLTEETPALSSRASRFPDNAQLCVNCNQKAVV